VALMTGQTRTNLDMSGHVRSVHSADDPDRHGHIPLGMSCLVRSVGHPGLGGAAVMERKLSIASASVGASSCWLSALHAGVPQLETQLRPKVPNRLTKAELRDYRRQ